MKALPKRKGNDALDTLSATEAGLNESPSEKEGKCGFPRRPPPRPACLNESPSEKEGKCNISPPKLSQNACLNESPSEKEGKSSDPGV